MKKFLVLLLFCFPLIVNAEDCWEINNVGINNRTDGHQGQCRPIPGIKAKGNPSASCISLSSSDSSVVTFGAGCFYSKGHGIATGHLSVPAYCTCNNTAVNIDFSVQLYEWGFSSITIDNYDISPTFSDSVKDYNVTVKSGTITLRLKVHDKDSGTEVSLDGSKVSVTTNNGKERTYQIKNLKNGNNKILITTNSHGRIDKYNLTVNYDKPKEVNKMYFDNEEIKLFKGESTQLKLNIEPADADTSDMTWTSSSPSVASVEDGLVKALGVGKTTITAKSRGKSASISVDVGIRPSSITFDKDFIQIQMGEDKRLSYKIEPYNTTNKRVTFSSSNSKVADVDESGYVYGKTAGRTVITITAEDNGLTADCVVEVAQIVEDIKLTQDYMYVLSSENKRIEYSTLPSSIKYPYLEWIVYDEDILSIEDGVVKPKTAGQTVVVAKSGSVLSNPMTIEVINDDFKDDPQQEEESNALTIILIIGIILVMGGLGYFGYRYKRKLNNEE